MPQKRGEPANRRKFGQYHPRDAHRRCALAHIKQQRRRRQPFAPRAEHIGRADIARANLAQIARAKHFGKDKAKGNRPKQIANPNNECDSARV